MFVCCCWLTVFVAADGGNTFSITIIVPGGCEGVLGNLLLHALMLPPAPLVGRGLRFGWLHCLSSRPKDPLLFLRKLL